MAKFKDRDIVRHVTSPQEMVVVNIIEPSGIMAAKMDIKFDAKIVCEWLDNNGKYYKEAFNENDLISVKPYNAE